MITVMRRARRGQGEMWLRGSTMLGTCCLLLLLEQQRERRHQPRPCHIHLHSKLTRQLRCVRICACCAWVFYAGAVRTSCNGDRVFRPQLCVTDRWPCWPPVCTLSERSPGCQAVTSTYTREQFLSPTFFTKKATSHVLLSSSFFCHCAIQISLSPPTLAGSKRGDAESREYSLFKFFLKDL